MVMSRRNYKIGQETSSAVAVIHCIDKKDANYSEKKLINFL